MENFPGFVNCKRLCELMHNIYKLLILYIHDDYASDCQCLVTQLTNLEPNLSNLGGILNQFKVYVRLFLLVLSMLLDVLMV